MDYTETLDYMFRALPMYHRVGAAAYKADIQPTLDFMEHLGHPERRLPCIHVAGTNGKGSVSHMLASILQHCGYRVGLYTSPHLVDFRERIRVNGAMIGRDAVTHFVAEHRAAMERLQLSFFEMTVGLAFDHFVREQVDIAVVEVGMGGRLDSTNVVTPLLSVITNIGLEHTQFLGDTLAKIAGEKAGIIKAGVPVVIGESHPETAPVFNARATACHAPIVFADHDYRFEQHPTADPNSTLLCGDILYRGAPRYDDLRSPLSGSYQKKNLVTLAAAVDTLRDQLPQLGVQHAVLPLDADAVRYGVAHVVDDTGLHGRWEQIGSSPLTICETAHNSDGIDAMLQRLSTMRYRQLHLVYGCVSDKDFSTILRMLPSDAVRYYTQPSVPRRLPVDKLSTAAAQLGLPGSTYADVHSAIAAARAAAATDDLVLVTGSIFLIADALSKA